MQIKLPLLVIAACLYVVAGSLGADQETDAWYKALDELRNRGAVMGMSRDPVATWFQFPEQTTDAQLKAFPFVPHEFSVHLHGARVTDAGLKELKGTPNLIGLNLRRTRITDAGLKELAGINKLASLSLEDTAITDAGLDDLKKLKALRVLDLTDSRVTFKGVAALRTALPNCKINWTERPTIKTDLKQREEARKKYKAIPPAILSVEEPITISGFSQHERRSTSSGFIEIFLRTRPARSRVCFCKAGAMMIRSGNFRSPRFFGSPPGVNESCSRWPVPRKRRCSGCFCAGRRRRVPTRRLSGR